MILINERIIQIINGQDGIKASRLCAHLATEFLSLTGHQIRRAVIDTIHSEDLVEVEVILPNGKHESLILPNGTSIKGISTSEDLGSIDYDPN